MYFKHMDREKILSCNRCKNRLSKNSKQRKFCSEMINSDKDKCWKLKFDKRTRPYIEDNKEN